MAKYLRNIINIFLFYLSCHKMVGTFKILTLAAAINEGKSESVLEDALYQRQQACTIFNSLWDSSVWVEINEVASGGDMNMDGLIGGDSYDGEYETENNPGEETEEDNG